MLHPRTPPSSALHRFSAEFQLVLLCLRWPYTDDSLQMIAAAAEQVRDWTRVERIAARHRVVGLVYKGLSAIPGVLPPDVDQRFRDVAARHTQLGLRLTLESARLHRLFEGSGIEPIFLKGAALTQAMYRNLGLRFSKDIDMLVQPDQVAAAVEILRHAGYQPLHPLATETQHLPTWIRYGKAIDWHEPATGILLELHWRLTDLPLLRHVEPHRHVQQVTIAGSVPVHTLSGDLLITYLCVHGASHGWGRLKWLADIYALVPQDNAAAVEDLYRRTSQLDGGRAVAQALLLCHDLFHLEIGRIARMTEDDVALAFLRSQVLRLLSSGDEVIEVDQQRFGTTGVYLSRFFLGSGVEAVLSEARTWTHRPEEVVQWRLPHALLFLLPLKRLGAWMRTRVRHGGRSPA